MKDMILEIKNKWGTETLNTNDIESVSEVYCDANWVDNAPCNWRFVYTYFKIHKTNDEIITIYIENGWDAFFDGLPRKQRNVNDGGLMWMEFRKTESCKKSIEEAELKRSKVLEHWGGEVIKI